MPISLLYEPVTNDFFYTVSNFLNDTCLSMPTGQDSTKRAVNITIDMDYANAINQPGYPIVDARIRLPAIEALLWALTLSYSDTLEFQYLQTPYTNIPGNGTAGDDAAWIEVTDTQARESQSKFLSTILAAIVTDGLARIAGNGVDPFSPHMFLFPDRGDGMLHGLNTSSTLSSGFRENLGPTNEDDASNHPRLNLQFQPDSGSQSSSSTPSSRSSTASTY
jgi:hypothetical protein